MSYNWAQNFPMLTVQMNGKRLAYLDSGATALKPKIVAERMTAYLTQHTSNVHRGIYRLSEENTSAFEVVRDQVVSFLNASQREEVIFTKGTTESINLIAQTWGRENIQAGDEIILTELEHHANIVAWWILARDKKAIINIVPILADGQLDIEKYKQLLGEKTKLVAFTMVSNTIGVITPYREMIKLAKNVGAVVSLDAAQAAPHFKLDVQALGADFLSFSGHKVYGPNAVGVLWGRRDLLEAMPPYQGGGSMISTVSFENITWNRLPEKFEAGTPAIAEVLGLGAALEFVNTVGVSELERIDHELMVKTTKALEAIPGVRIFGTHSHKIATFSFEVKGIHSQDLGQVLDKEGVAIRTGHHCTQPLMKCFGVTAMARASFGPYNNDEDIAQLVKGISKAKALFG